jgi:hypothetical protein
MNGSTAIHTALLLGAAHCLALDSLAARTSKLLSAKGISTLLLKGPATARRLYAARPDRRLYSDVDLLVAPDQFGEAQQVLRTAGYQWRQEGFRPDETHWYETGWGAPDSDFTIDLHRGFHGVQDNALFWTEMWAAREHFDLAGERVAVPSAAGTAMLVVLHAVSPGKSAKPLRDLLAANHVFGFETWSAAAGLALAVGAGAAFRAGLELLPDGVELVERLQLRGPVAADHWLAGRQRSRVSVNLAAARDRPRLRDRAGYVLRKMLPSPAFLRLHDLRARRGRGGLLLAYLSRWGRGCSGAPRAVLDLRQARRGTRAR